MFEVFDNLYSQGKIGQRMIRVRRWTRHQISGRLWDDLIIQKGVKVIHDKTSLNSAFKVVTIS